MIDKLNDSCCGCGACKDFCPHGAIDFQINKEGFFYPYINKDKCTECNACERICPIISTPPCNLVLSSNAAYSKHKPANSSSGGMFYVFAKEVLNQEGVVYGAAYDDNMYLKHTRVTSLNDLPKLCGSKYVQSDCIGIHSKVRQDLKSGLLVLFSGTPCQVAGLKNFLRRDYDNLILLDLICHGVPSPGIFADYIKYCSKLRNKDVKYFLIRDNRERWDNSFRSTLTFKDGKQEYNSMLTNLWNRIFFSELAIRKNCEDCKFANMNRIGDISLGDFWGIEAVNHEMYHKDGVSLILINTQKGEKLFSKINNKITSSIANTCEKEHPNLYHSIKQNPRRIEFMDDYITLGFPYIANKFFGYNRKLDFKIRLSMFVKKIKKLWI